jgi:hypothetical protein
MSAGEMMLRESSGRVPQPIVRDVEVIETETPLLKMLHATSGRECVDVNVVVTQTQQTQTQSESGGSWLTQLFKPENKKKPAAAAAAAMPAAKTMLSHTSGRASLDHKDDQK